MTDETRRSGPNGWLILAISLGLTMAGGLTTYGSLSARLDRAVEDVAKLEEGKAAKADLDRLERSLEKANGLLFQIALALGVKPVP